TGSIENGWHAQGIRVPGDYARLARAFSRHHKSANGSRLDERLIAREQDYGVYLRMRAKQMLQSAADGSAESALPFRVVNHERRRFAQFGFDKIALSPDDDGNARATRFGRRANGASNQALSPKRQQLFRPPEARRSAGCENYRADVSHSSTGSGAGLRTMFHPWIGT